MVNIWDMCDILQEWLSHSLKIKRFGTRAKQSVGTASQRPWYSCNSANRLGANKVVVVVVERRFLNLSSAFFGKALHLKPECKCVNSDFAIQPQTNSNIKEQLFHKYQLTELGLSGIHLKDWSRHSLKSGHSLETFCIIGKHVSTVGWSPMWNYTWCKFLVETVFTKFHINFSIWTYRHGKKSLKRPPLPSFFTTS